MHACLLLHSSVCMRVEGAPVKMGEPEKEGNLGSLGEDGCKDQGARLLKIQNKKN